LLEYGLDGFDAPKCQATRIAVNDTFSIPSTDSQPPDAQEAGAISSHPAGPSGMIDASAPVRAPAAVPLNGRPRSTGALRSRRRTGWTGSRARRQILVNGLHVARGQKRGWAIACDEDLQMTMQGYEAQKRKLRTDRGTRRRRGTEAWDRKKKA
jgi:hypothetical protein